MESVKIVASVRQLAWVGWVVNSVISAKERLLGKAGVLYAAPAVAVCNNAQLLLWARCGRSSSS